MSKLSHVFQSSYSLIESVNQELKSRNSLKNIMMVPKIKAIYLSVGAGKFFKNSADMEKIQKSLSFIANQHAVLTTAKKSVAAFDVREGMKTGVKVTMRGKKMYEFIDRLKLIYLPRMRDFKGLSSKSFNGKSYSFGLKDSTLVFPEIIAKLNTYDFTFGMNITFVFNVANNNLQKNVLESFGLPFEDSKAFE
ncbi:large ribosomal subunit protein uL5 [Alphaproteobacteria bacterium endosymbiont of Tiliacea citrago]|uniref:large ribosomal subunit protein uL5 n=1 Tax=Alphaproteobacteria bacterium endosymbiont of Tiliacea citrago TaxID=3077944 RepID=UPI00313B84A5